MRSLFVSLLLSSMSFAQGTVTFEDLTLGQNGNVHTSPFSSGGVAFNNVYDAGSDSWSGFSYSNVVNLTTAGYTNQYAAYATIFAAVPPATASTVGAGGSANYAVAYDGSGYGLTPVITLPSGARPVSLAITNTTYALISMRDGDSFMGQIFAKKFGGDSGNDPDYFKLIITGRDANLTPTGSIDFYLADYRFANNQLDYIVKDWTTVDVSGLPSSTRSLAFSFESTDIGMFGINTPTYFAVDNITYVPEPAAAVLSGIIALAAVRRRFVRIDQHAQQRCC